MKIGRSRDKVFPAEVIRWGKFCLGPEKHEDGTVWVSVMTGIGYPLQYSWAHLVKNLPAMQETWV